MLEEDNKNDDQYENDDDTSPPKDSRSKPAMNEENAKNKNKNKKPQFPVEKLDKNYLYAKELFYTFTEQRKQDTHSPAKSNTYHDDDDFMTVDLLESASPSKDEAEIVHKMRESSLDITHHSIESDDAVMVSKLNDADMTTMENPTTEKDADMTTIENPTTEKDAEVITGLQESSENDNEDEDAKFEEQEKADAAAANAKVTMNVDSTTTDVLMHENEDVNEGETDADKDNADGSRKTTTNKGDEGDDHTNDQNDEFDDDAGRIVTKRGTKTIILTSKRNEVGRKRKRRNTRKNKKGK